MYPHMDAQEKWRRPYSRRLSLPGQFDISMRNVIHHDLMQLKEEIESADALFIGSPTINRDALKPIWDVLSVTDAVLNAGKPVGVFGSFGWSGEAVKMLVERLRSLKLNVVGEGIRANFVPSEEELAAVSEYAKEILPLLAN